jgi:hypothetical protein
MGHYILQHIPLKKRIGEYPFSRFWLDMGYKYPLIYILPMSETKGPIMYGHNIVIQLHGFLVPLHNSTLHVMYPLCTPQHEIQIFPKKQKKSKKANISKKAKISKKKKILRKSQKSKKKSKQKLWPPRPPWPSWY